MINILLADDDILTLNQLNLLISAMKQYKISGQVQDGLAAISEIMEINPDADIVVVSSVGTQSQLRQAIQLGAKDFIQKPLNGWQIESILKNRFEGGE